MKIIDLLNRIANGEEVPKKIKRTWTYEWKYDDIRDKYTYLNNDGERFDNDWLVMDLLNTEVEIIENDKKIEKIDDEYFERAGVNLKHRIVKDKINEIIDKLNEMGDK